MKGIYILVIKLNKSIKIRTKSKDFILKKGTYAYVGSAQNNLKKRINRHLSNKKKLHWHIDFLLKNKNSKITNIFYKKATKEQECKTARDFLKNNKSIPIKNFGCSDCKCESHLIKINNQNSTKNRDFREFHIIKQ